ncbi:MATE family efflux transporter [Larsenimonas salina]|uniref:MATE family efflux transporter n=1 Tax=Larsenimonas salina TaxID=1295565 RepID=UPI0020743AD2|nr:MATE family efflux transporter [Larsenimonas salina]MCM5705252.1 MATE family efflux transporter [Larsenimonas salina]
MLEGPILASLLKLAVPIVFANILQSAYQLIDAFWVGRLGGQAVAAVSVCTPVIFFLFALGSGFSVAGSTLIAQYIGANRQREADHVTAQTLLMVVIASVILAALGHLLAPLLLDGLGITDAVRQDALAFLRIALTGTVFTFGFSMCQALLRGAGEVRLPLYIVAGTVGLNVVLDPLFIFGWGAFPALGVAGAALATLVTQGLAFACAVALLARGKLGIRLSWRNMRPDTAVIRRAFSIGTPASIELSARALAMNFMVVLVTGFGTAITAAYGVGMNILGFIVIPALGLSMSTAAVVGQNIGAGLLERARHIARLSSVIAFLTLSIIGVVIFLSAPQLVAVFVPEDPEVIEHGAEFLRVVALTFGFMGFQMVLTGAFRAAGKTLIPMTLTLISQWGVQFPLAFVLSSATPLGGAGIWWAFPITNVATALITWLWFAKGHWLTATLAHEAPTSKQATSDRPA